MHGTSFHSHVSPYFLSKLGWFDFNKQCFRNLLFAFSFYEFWLLTESEDEMTVLNVNTVFIHSKLNLFHCLLSNN